MLRFVWTPSVPSEDCFNSSEFRFVQHTLPVQFPKMQQMVIGVVMASNLVTVVFQEIPPNNRQNQHHGDPKHGVYGGL